MLGIFIGSLIVWFLVKKIGMPIVSVFVEPEKFQNLWFFRTSNEECRSVLFSPGTPKDLLTWAAGLLHIRPVRFFLISTAARLPSNLTSTLAGSSLISGDFMTMINCGDSHQRNRNTVSPPKTGKQKRGIRGFPLFCF